jgi:hypothetical protein
MLFYKYGGDAISALQLSCNCQTYGTTPNDGMSEVGVPYRAARK